MINVSCDCKWCWLACKGALFWVFTGKKHLGDIKGELPSHPGKVCVCVRRCFLIGFGLSLPVHDVGLDWVLVYDCL